MNSRLPSATAELILTVCPAGALRTGLKSDLVHLPSALNREDSHGLENARVWRDRFALREPMPKPYSLDSSEPVVEAVAAGTSRREVAQLYGLSSSVVVLWVQHWEATGSIAARPSGGSISPLEDHVEFLLDLVVEQLNLTLDEVVAAMAKATAIVRGGSAPP